ncbi:recombinase family protein [Enterococcus innesii]|uniref:recombinase family protein n=1 Tax=Enterococcus innesii TaxID=2839759 RepID=UPI003B59CB94
MGLSKRAKISITRELKALPNPVGVFIEDLNINTLDTTSETSLLMLSVVAQAESEQKSEAITWSIIERFKKGLPIIPTHNFLGFTKDRFGKVVIEESEAEIVRFIYKNFLEGVRAVDIASLLNEANIPTAASNQWKSSSIYRVLRNEKYFGLVIMQKTFTVDCFTHKKKVNRGEKPKYLLRNGLPAIVSEDEWNLVQELLLNPRKGFKKKAVKNIEKPRIFVSTIKSGVFKGFIVIDAKWSKEDVAEVLSKGEHQ